MVFPRFPPFSLVFLLFFPANILVARTEFLPEKSVVVAAAFAIRLASLAVVDRLSRDPETSRPQHSLACTYRKIYIIYIGQEEMGKTIKYPVYKDIKGRLTLILML